ncbi:MAG: ion channel [Crocinitomicaceae bacterium]
MGKEIENTGFGDESSQNFKRIINADGTYNIKKIGATANWKDTYKYLVEISWTKFLLLLFSSYVFLNVIFSILYLLIGYSNISGINDQNGSVFMQVFFFSVQTFTTVGYGVMAPTGFWTQMMASVEAFTGFLSFSLMTGLLYGRFSRPVAKIIFSANAIIAPYGNKRSLQVKIANERDNVLMEVKAKIILVFDKTEADGSLKKQYFKLPLEISEVSLLPLSWTLVHAIDEDSPFYEKNEDEIAKLHSEILVIVSGYDEVFSQEINARKSYYHTELAWNRKFKKIFAPDKEGNLVIDLSDLNQTENLN